MSPVCFSSSSASIVTNYPDGFTDIAAEAAVLGSLIIDNDKEYIGPVRDILKDEFYFAKPEHRHIYNAIMTLHANGSGIDCLLLVSELQKQQRLKAVGGVDYVVQVAESTPTKANAIFYADKVLEKYKQRLGWDYIQKQQAILRSGGNWNAICRSRKNRFACDPAARFKPQTSSGFGPTASHRACSILSSAIRASANRFCHATCRRSFRPANAGLTAPKPPQAASFCSAMKTISARSSSRGFYPTAPTRRKSIASTNCSGPIRCSRSQTPTTCGNWKKPSSISAMCD
jgi:hypothetical protein